MKIAIFQFCPQALDIDANLDIVSEAVEDAATRGADLLLLPELWSTGLLPAGRAAEAAARTPGLTEAISGLCAEHGITVAGGLPEAGDHRASSRKPSIWNTLFVTGPQGDTWKYRKINLFRPMGEDRVFRPGNVPCMFTLPGHSGMTAGLLICFDLRFPEIARELAWRGARLLLVSALWPMVRRDHFQLLVKARAVENQCFAAASNACGSVAGTEFAGASLLIDPAGRELCRAGNSRSLMIQEIDISSTTEARKRFLTAHPPRQWACRKEKFLTSEQLTPQVELRKSAGQKMVFTNGCFDILHAGHVSYLEKARRHGDFMVVGLNSDVSVQKIKGPERPVNPQDMRARILSGLECVDYVTLFHETTPEKLIGELLPDVLVKGADWEEHEIAGAGLVKGRGGRIIRIPFTHDLSTTDTIRRIKALTAPWST